jgi:hypothetical protein
MKAFVVYIDTDELSAADLRVAVILGADCGADTEPAVTVERIVYDGYRLDVRTGERSGPKALTLRYKAQPLSHGYADSDPF